MFYLKIQQINQVCLFELSWGKGQQLSVNLDYSPSLTGFYQEWQRVYLSFYKTALRGRVQASGSLNSPPVDWHAKLVQAEAKFLYEFHRWLRSGELYEIRAAIAKASSSSDVNVFLTCNSTQLERFPWEAWEISDTNSGTIRIIRTPLNIRNQTISSGERPRARVLAILGDDTGLNFKTDREAVRSLAKIADIEFVGWQPGKDINMLKNDICSAIADAQGWDILFFAGHSNETNITGGELAIAPGVSMLISEIAPLLTKAKEKGLQFAIFNSCSGLSIANSLIDLGLSQVAIMREPIHNQVAQEFLVRFLQSLAEYKDVSESTIAACQYLKLEKNLTYPSAYLIPSLYCHPDAVLFRLKPTGIKQWLQSWLPTRQEIIFLAIFVFLSLQLPVQDFLLQRRVLSQAIYRRITRQIPPAPPPVLVVSIDQNSINMDKIGNPKPIPRYYLARLIDKLSALDARVVGIDYILDRPQKNHDPQLAKSIQSAVKKRPFGTWFVFVELQDSAGQWIRPLPQLANPNWSLRGDMRLDINYMKLGMGDIYYNESLPFSYVMALAYKNNFKQSSAPLQPKLNSQEDFLSQVKNQIKLWRQQSYTHLFAPASHLQPITAFSYEWGQSWLHPIVDFSIPPNQVYQSIPAWQLLRLPNNSDQLRNIKQQVAIVIPGGYLDAGVSTAGEDNFPAPLAINYWRRQNGELDNHIFTGGEGHAYMTHHFLTGRLVVPLPDLWLIPVAALLGKGVSIQLVQSVNRRSKKLYLFPLGLGIVTVIYVILCCQIYISAMILLPLLFPSMTFWSYMLTALVGRKKYE